MDIEKFIKERPFLYHLTCKENATNIIKKGQLYSTNELVRLANNTEYENILRKRRSAHVEIMIGGEPHFIRDQKPISEINLAKCLTDGWSIGDFLYHLNDRVFMWPTVVRLWSHFRTYADENPVILRFSTKNIFDANPHVKFCRLNSGATRSNSYLGGAPPMRGAATLPAAEFNNAVREVAEVTFEKTCRIAGDCWYRATPEGRFYKVN